MGYNYTYPVDTPYIHAREGDNRKAGWFEVIVGKSITSEKTNRCFGFVTTYDDKSKRRLNTSSQSENPPIVVTDSWCLNHNGISWTVFVETSKRMNDVKSEIF